MDSADVAITNKTLTRRMPCHTAAAAAACAACPIIEHTHTPTSHLLPLSHTLLLAAPLLTLMCRPQATGPTTLQAAELQAASTWRTTKSCIKHKQQKQ